MTAQLTTQEIEQIRAAASTESSKHVRYDIRLHGDTWVCSAYFNRQVSVRLFSANYRAAFDALMEQAQAIRKAALA